MSDILLYYLSLPIFFKEKKTLNGRVNLFLILINLSRTNSEVFMYYFAEKKKKKGLF